MQQQQTRFVRTGTILKVLLVVFCYLSAPFNPAAFAQGPKGKSFGFGFSVGDPTAFAMRFWSSPLNSWDAAIGTSHLGNPHIHVDYLWHFPQAFNSRIVSLYAGVGGVIGFGERGTWFLGYERKGKEFWYYSIANRPVFAAKGVFGLDIIPRNAPLDIFFELDPIIGLSPGFGFDVEPALGIRFYP